MKLIELLSEIRDSKIRCPTKEIYKNRDIREPVKLAHAYTKSKIVEAVVEITD
jgi:hypothetical protein